MVMYVDFAVVWLRGDYTYNTLLTYFALTNVCSFKHLQNNVQIRQFSNYLFAHVVVPLFRSDFRSRLRFKEARKVGCNPWCRVRCVR